MIKTFRGRYLLEQNPILSRVLDWFEIYFNLFKFDNMLKDSNCKIYVLQSDPINPRKF